MATEGATLINDLNAAAPTGQGAISDGDDEFRQLKTVLQNQFPNMGNAQVTASAAELSRVAGVTSPIQTQIDDLALVQGYGGFNSSQIGEQITLPANGTWIDFTQVAASSFSDGVFVTSNPSTGLISLISGSPLWVRLHSLVVLKRITNVDVSPLFPVRSKWVRGSNNQTPDGAVMVFSTPEVENSVSLIVETLDKNPSQAGETYKLQLNQAFSQALTFEIWSMNVWIEVIGRT